MSILVPLIYFLSISLTLSLFLKKKFNDIIIFSYIIPVFLIYFTGIFGNTKIGFYLSIILCFIWIIPILKNIKNVDCLKSIAKKYFTMGFFIYVILFVVISIYLRYATFFQWDDFTHWGPMVKEMFRLDKLYCVEESLLPVHKDYPPFVSILELLWCYLSFGFEERFIYRAIGIFSVSLIIPFLNIDKDESRRKRICLFIIAITVFITSFFVDFMAEQGNGLLSNLITVYPDALVGLFGAYVFVYIYKEEKFSSKDCSLIGLLLSFLLMIKQISFALYLINLLLLCFKIYKSGINKKKIITYIISFVCIPLLMYLSWNIYSNQFIIDSQFSLSKISISDLINIIFFNKGLEYQIITKNNFISSLIDRPMLRFLNLTYFGFTAIIVVLLLIVLKFALKENKYNTFSILISVIIGALGFAFTMFVLYLFTYSEGEAIRLASFERYMQTYLVFELYTLIFITTIGVSKCNNFKTILITEMAMLIMCVLFIQTNYQYLKLKTEYDGLGTQYEFVELTKQIDEFVDSEDKVLIISQTKDHFLEIYLRYRYLNYDFTYVAVGEPDETFPYRLPLTFEEWQEYYSEYDYIYTYNTDEDFYHNYWLNLQEEYLLNNRFFTVNENNYLVIVPWISSEE